ncbi:hypothetical protein NQ318_002826 [Aromia moschata]|uniref:DUF4817 domain-containing protein n=1 Tax=Aromia moschata TaxID=1265417 RepID=A0AAV8XGQ7_9CUCU|nr:hypothetical protein NQ318_002826 [Aromia moschata]
MTNFPEILPKKRPSKNKISNSSGVAAMLPSLKPSEEADRMISETSSQFRRPRQNPEEITSPLDNSRESLHSIFKVVAIRIRREILIMIGCGDTTRSQNTVCETFNQKYPNKHINQSTVSKIEKRFRAHGNVNDLPKGRRPKVANEEMSLNVLLSVQENHHASSRTLGQQRGILHLSIQKILRTHKYYPYKVQLIHELNEYDPDRRVQFCGQMLTICNANPMFRNAI